MSIEILFYILGFIALVSSLGMISSKQPVFASLMFIITLLSLAGLFALLSNAFMFAVQIILYAGAIITLLLFIIMFLGIKSKNIPDETERFKMMALITVLLIPFTGTIIQEILKMPSHSLAIIIDDFGSLSNLGMQLFNNWIFPFELISILLLVALVGAVTLGKGARND